MIQIQNFYRAPDVDSVLARGPNQLHFGHDFYAYTIPIHYQCYLHYRPNHMPIPCPWGTHTVLWWVFPSPSSFNAQSHHDSLLPTTFLSFTFLIILLPPDLHTSHLFESLLYSFTQIQSNRLQHKKVLCLIKIFLSPSQWSSCFQGQFMKEGFRNRKIVNNPLEFSEIRVNFGSLPHSVSILFFLYHAQILAYSHSTHMPSIKK